jgi:hypothetical protein
MLLLFGAAIWLTDSIHKTAQNVGFIRRLEKSVLNLLGLHSTILTLRASEKFRDFLYSRALGLTGTPSKCTGKTRHGYGCPRRIAWEDADKNRVRENNATQLSHGKSHFGWMERFWS